MRKSIQVKFWIVLYDFKEPDYLFTWNTKYAPDTDVFYCLKKVLAHCKIAFHYHNIVTPLCIIIRNPLKFLCLHKVQLIMKPYLNVSIISVIQVH